jgi:membrane-associated phospholipid phosphatase
MQFELELIKLLQQLRSDFFDGFFQFWTMFGEELIIIGILGFLYWVYNKRVGEYVGITVFISLVLNSVLKTLFRRPRPFQVDNEIVNIRPQTSSGYSFPSGHTQGAATVFASAAIWLKKRYFTIATIIIIIMVAMSRMYIGVHFLTDVIVASLLGIGLSYGFAKFFSKREDNSKIYQYILYINLVLLFGVYILHLFTSEASVGMTNAQSFYDKLEGAFKMTGAMVGFVFGLKFERKYTNFINHKILWKNIIRFAAGVGIVMLVRIGLKAVFGIFVDSESLLEGQFFAASIAMIFDLVRYFFMVYVAIGIYPLVFKKLNI